MAEAIWSPTGNDGARMPAGTVTRNITPVTVLIEILITSHFPRNIIRGISVIFPVVAIEGPFIKTIAIRKLPEIVVKMLFVA